MSSYVYLLRSKHILHLYQSFYCTSNVVFVVVVVVVVVVVIGGGGVALYC